jgi:proteasome lid subunit RPN8/RPN11
VRAVVVPDGLLDAMRAHARATYPDECCGFLIAEPDPADERSPRTVVAVQHAANDFEGERRRRFVIRPEELRQAERAVERSGQIVGGFYHSHPDHPARPSQFDQEHAWPWYSYLVLAVTKTTVPAVGAFELDADSNAFQEVPLLPPPAAGPGVTASLRAPGVR